MDLSAEKFYDEMSDHYHLIFEDWDRSIERQSFIIESMINRYGIDKENSILDCACGIGTQTLGLAKLGYHVIGSDISQKEVERAIKEAQARRVDVEFLKADFRFLSDVFKIKFDAIIAMDNALPHITSSQELEKALSSIYAHIEHGGIFVASIRDYDEILKTKPFAPPPYIIETPTGRRIAFQIWRWDNDIYTFTQYIIIDKLDTLETLKFTCQYRAITRSELTSILNIVGFEKVKWIMPKSSGFYQPILIARK